MPGDTVADLCFIKDLQLYKREKPYLLFVGKPASAEHEKHTNVELETVSNVPVHDVRGRQHEYTIDEHGFQFVTHQQMFSDFDNENLISQHYLREVEKVISKNIPYANRVLVFDWRLRKQMTTAEANETISPSQLDDRLLLLAPSQTVHSDTTEFSLLKRVKHELPEEADDLLKGRVQLINFWRPLYHEVQNWPLFVCDGQTTPLENLVPVDQVTRSFVGDINYATYSDCYRWYYMSGMRTDEGVLFKSWDTKKGGGAKSKIIHTTVQYQLIPTSLSTLIFCPPP
ncbi:hypothetical protein FAUST_10975 [Fusarium austroamericanum]|uniref:Methyltransferase n=1 Tax=Fusarium austroamericanum TaxID=282268 RepID=A0AAN5YZW6_FUSAU|nr:hypothetical protein FAUST_10975 [Fusarium austroamericanum]